MKYISRSWLKQYIMSKEKIINECINKQVIE